MSEHPAVIAAQPEKDSTMTRELSPLQIELIDRHRQRNSGRMTATMGYDQQGPAKPAQPNITDPAYIASVYARWNAPPTSSLRDHAKQ